MGEHAQEIVHAFKKQTKQRKTKEKKNSTTTNPNLKKIRTKASQLKFSGKKLSSNFHVLFSLHFNHE